MVRSASPRTFLQRLRVEGNFVAREWNDGAMDMVHGQNEDVDLFNVLPTLADGTFRDKVKRLVVEMYPLQPHTTGRSLPDADVYDGIVRSPRQMRNLSKQPPVLSQSLAQYSRSLDRPQSLIAGGRSEAALRAQANAHQTLRDDMMIIHTIINTQLFPSPTDLLNIPRSFSDYLTVLGVTGGLILDGLLLVTGYVGSFAAYFSPHVGGLIAGFLFDRPKAVRQLRSSNYEHWVQGVYRCRSPEATSLNVASMEEHLADLRRCDVDDLKMKIPLTGGNWTLPGVPTPAFYVWVTCVARIGHLRRTDLNYTTIGAIGPTRIGKSSVLGKIFPQLRTTLKAGSADQNRTINIQAYTIGNTLVMDCPGLDEGSAQLRQETADALDLLDVVIVVLEFSKAAADGVNQTLKVLAGLRRNRNSQPFRVLLNRVDETMSTQTSEELSHYETDIRDRKAVVVNRLRQELAVGNMLYCAVQQDYLTCLLELSALNIQYFLIAATVK